MFMKIIAVLVLFCVPLLAHDATAQAFDVMYMTASSGSHTQKTSFGWDETPWLYVNLPASGGANVTTSSWFDSDSVQYDTFISGDTDEWWISLSNWNTVKKMGQWDVNTNYTLAVYPPASGSGSTSFTVTPEPASMVLFVTGGAVLIFRKGLKGRVRQI